MRQKSSIGYHLRACRDSGDMITQVKSGYILRYKKRIFGKDWREEYVVLYSDSTLAWYRDRHRSEPDGGLVIKDAPHMVAVGQFTSMIPYRPELPNGSRVACLMAFGTKKKDKVQWFLCKDEDEVNCWMTAISNTLPPPPRPWRSLAERKDGKSQFDPSAPPPMNTGYATPNHTAPPPYQPPAPMTNNYFNYPNGGTGMPQNAGATVIVQRDNRRSDSGFATGMMTGALLGTAAGSWGWGGGGLGWGCGYGWGGYGRGGFNYSDTDIHINNHYDNDTTIVNNTTTGFDRSSPNDGGLNDDPGMGAATFNSEYMGADHGEDDFGGDYDIACDGYDVGGGFDFMF